MKRDGDGLFHPETEGEVQALVTAALRERRAVRVRGSLHAPPTRVFTDAWLDERPERAIDLSLDRLDAVHLDAEARTVRVQGGCRFGRDPRDPTGRSRLERGLVVTVTWEGLDGAARAGLVREVCVGLTSEVRTLGGKVHLTKNVFARKEDLGAMYARDVEQLRAVKQRFDPAGVLGSDFVDALFAR